MTNITGIPKNVVVFKGENYSLGTIFGIFQKKEKLVTTSFTSDESNIISEETVHLSLFNLVNVRNVSITTIKNTEVIPLRKYHRIEIILKWSFSNRNVRK